MIFFPLFLLLSLLLLSLLPFLLSRKRKTINLPPGPHPWPIIGNLLQIGKTPHVDLANMARTHGALISVRLGTQLVVVASSPETASLILKTHDRALSGRCVPHTARVKNYAELSLVWSPQCDEHWKKLRTIWRAELFSPKMLDVQTQLRQQKVSEMVGFLIGKEGRAVRIGEVVFGTVFNLLCNLAFSRDVLDLENGDDGVGGGLKGYIWRIMELAGSINVGDFFPVVGGFDVQGLRRESEACAKRVYDIWDVLVRERREEEEEGDGLKEDFLNVLIKGGFSDFEIRSLLLDMFLAGTDTSTTMVEWTITELIKNPEAMHKVRVELDRVIADRRNPENSLKESHLIHLTYFHACIKEALRLHPPAPLLLPHRATETCEVMGYTIPRDCQVMVNAWAISRDPKTWQDPLDFLPDRFVDSNLDYRGNDFEFVPFGAGRRICPGMPLAVRIVPLIVASLIHSFDWCLPNGLHQSQLNMDEKFGLTLIKEQPLILVPNSRK